MPRPKSAAAAKNGATSATKAAPKKAKAAVAARKRVRRSPYDLVQDLRAKRDAVAASLGERIAKLDQRIQALETKHDAKIKVSELLNTRTAEELADELVAVRAQQSLLRKAMKQKPVK